MRKAAKVYDASEAVEGMKPKTVFESHKKCTPGEFGMHVKSAMKLRLGTPAEYGAFTAGGAGLGAILGALTSERGKLLRGALRGGLVGAGAGAGFNLGGNLVNGATYDHVLNHGPLVAGGALGGGLLGAGMVDTALNPPDKKKKREDDEKQAAEPWYSRFAKGVASLAQDPAVAGRRAMLANRAVVRAPELRPPEPPRQIHGFTIPPLQTRRDRLEFFGYSAANRQALKQTAAVLGGGALASPLLVPGQNPATATATTPTPRPAAAPTTTPPLFPTMGRRRSPLTIGVQAGQTEKANSAHEFGEKVAAKPWYATMGQNIANMVSGVKPKPVMTPPAISLKPGMTPAALERTTGTLLNSAGVPVPKKAPLPVSPAPKITITPEQAAAATPLAKTPGLRTPAASPTKVTISPAEAAAGRAKMIITPDDLTKIHSAGATPAPPFMGFGRPAPYMPQVQRSGPKIDLSGMFPTPRIKANSAREFGERVAFDFNSIDWNALKTPALGGAALGAGLGGLAGLINPGETESGKRRSRFGAMLRGVIDGGALGGLGGAAAGHFAPEPTKKMMNSISMAADPVNYQEPVAQIMGRPYPANMRIDPKLRAMYNTLQYGG